MSISFHIEKKMKSARGRAGILETPHGVIRTPAFVTVGTKATVKALSPEMVASLGAEVVLANTYHLYFEPGREIMKKAGGLHAFMNWHGPTMTDSGGFQAFSLGAAYGESVSKIAKERGLEDVQSKPQGERPAKVTEEGVSFRSPLDGSEHFFTPEKSIEIQHDIGADLIFAFDECTSPQADKEYQKEAMERTHRWAERSLARHKELQETSVPQDHPFPVASSSLRRDLSSQAKKYQRESAEYPRSSALLGIVQGGRFRDLREESARVIGSMDFPGFGIGGSFDKEDMYSVVGWVNDILPEEKPRHLLGIGEPGDLFGGIENGCDLFDCVAPTRIARNGTLYTKDGTINILNARFRTDFGPIENGCACYTCTHYTRAYLAHLFRAKEMFAATLASVHNLYFIVNLVKGIREAVLSDTFAEKKEEFLRRYYKA